MTPQRVRSIKAWRPFARGSDKEKARLFPDSESRVKRTVDKIGLTYRRVTNRGRGIGNVNPSLNRPSPHALARVSIIGRDARSPRLVRTRHDSPCLEKRSIAHRHPVGVGPSVQRQRGSRAVAPIGRVRGFGVFDRAMPKGGDVHVRRWRARWTRSGTRAAHGAEPKGAEGRGHVLRDAGRDVGGAPGRRRSRWRGGRPDREHARHRRRRRGALLRVRVVRRARRQGVRGALRSHDVDRIVRALDAPGPVPAGADATTTRSRRGSRRRFATPSRRATPSSSRRTCTAARPPRSWSCTAGA